jgi:predicted aconitase with swiveling domain
MGGKSMNLKDSLYSLDAEVCFMLSPVIPGEASGEILAAKTPLSFWGGVDAHSGIVTDIRHELCGKSISGKVLVIPESRGSCSGSGIMLEMLRCGTAPAAMVVLKAEAILAAGSIIGKELYDRYTPIYIINNEAFSDLDQGGFAVLKEDRIYIVHHS